MQTITIKTYKFNELSDEAKQKAIDNNRYYNVDDNYWYEWTLEDWQARLKDMGFDDAKIYFSGFASQGDGASFECHVDIEKWLTVNHGKTLYKAILNDIDNVTIAITKNGHYQHEMMMSVDVESYSDNDKVNNTVDELGNKILENAREQARLIYKELENVYDYEISNDAIA